MHLRWAALAALSSVALSGCAAMVTAWKNDPLQAYAIKDPTLYAMTGDRRTAVLMDTDAKKRFCAESLPDAVAAFSAASKANAAVPEKASAGFEDATYAGLLQTFQRTEIAEVYRQMGWNICLAWAQGATADPVYLGLLQQYLTGGIEVIKARAAQPQVWPTIAPGSLFIGPGAAAAGQPAPKKEDDKPKPDGKPTSVDLGDGVQLQSASSTSGYCIKAPAGYVGTGTPNKPKVNDALPLCKEAPPAT